MYQPAPGWKHLSSPPRKRAPVPKDRLLTDRFLTDLPPDALAGPRYRSPAPGTGRWVLSTAAGSFWTGAIIGQVMIPHTTVLLEDAKRFETRGSAVEVAKVMPGFEPVHLDHL